MSSTALVKGSLAQVARSEGATIAEAFANADTVLILDTSSSMSLNDSSGGQTRFAVACREAERIQRDYPGKFAIVSFATEPWYCPYGVPSQPGGSTNLAAALRFCKVADVPGIRFIVISDGVPDSEALALDEARRFRARIDTVYTGPENDHEGGRDFLRRLAAASGGRSVVADRAKELAGQIERVLLAAPM